MFRVGQKVTMKEPWRRGPTRYCEVFTQFGAVYTIREILEVAGGAGLRFDEIRNEPRKYLEIPEPIELPFPAYNFRPVVERKTDISVFTALLTEEKIGASA
jgi:hypothetical protein